MTPTPPTSHRAWSPAPYLALSLLATAPGCARRAEAGTAAALASMVPAPAPAPEPPDPTLALPEMDRPTGRVWVARRAWDADAEREYGAFIASIGRAVARHRCRSLNECLNDPSINPLHRDGDPALAFRADCADVPYVLRAYFAYRAGLPFAHAGAMVGDGPDARYLLHAHPQGLVAWDAYPTPRALFETVGDVVHSGYLRTAPGVEPSDFYQTAVGPGAIRPGTVYYDPNGHVLVVYEVGRDGAVKMFDGHVGGGITHRVFGPGFVLGSARLGGGFKNFRPVRALPGGGVAQDLDASLADYGGDQQFTHHVGFADWVRSRLAAPRATHRGRVGPLRQSGVASGPSPPDFREESGRPSP